MRNWLEEVMNRKSIEKMREEAVRNDKRPVKLVPERHNVWRIVYADE